MDSMDVNEITKVIDGVYKNITDNFNPASKQMIATGKAYLKSLHGASAACSMYLDAVAKVSKHAQQSSIGTSGDIGSSMMQIADVFKEIHTQQLTTLKAFYVDFLVPLETNLEKDVKVIQNEQKKFLVSHKHRVESYNKAVSNAKKVRKKSKKTSTASSNTLDKEIRIMQSMEEERSKLEGFCEEALKEALIQERRRYGFVLERQASLAKHYLSFFSKGSSSLAQKLDNWMKVSKSRESLPEPVQTNLMKNIKQHGEDECIYCSPRRPTEDTASISSQLRKTKSLEAGEMLNINCSTGKNQLTTTSRDSGHQNNMKHDRHYHQDLPLTSAGSLSRAKSDTSLGISNVYNGASTAIYGTTAMPLMGSKLIRSGYGDCNEDPSVKTEDIHSKPIALNSDSSFGGNSEPPHMGYAKAVFDYHSTGDNQLSFLEGDVIALIGERNRGWQFGENIRTQQLGWFPVAYTEKAMLVVDTKTLSSPVPPPIPPPIPNSAPIRNADNNGNSKRVGGATKSNLVIPTGCANDSLHSSNDSGFSNDILHGTQLPPPPQPEVDYSDEEPQLSNSEVLKHGTKWLMDRYHMSETTRINPSHRRRSLSSGNLSSSDQGSQTELGNVSVHNGAGSSPRGLQYLATVCDYETAKGYEKGGPLKKFLNRTKSLIWRRPSNAGDQYQNARGIDPHHNLQPQRALESISVADTASELWGSHSSIVEMTEFEMKELSRHNRSHVHAEESERETHDKHLNDSHHEQLGATIISSESDTVPSLPPRNSEQYSHPQKQGRSTQTQTQLSEDSSLIKSHAPPTLSTPLKEAENCIVVNDHTKRKKCTDPADYGCLYWSSGPINRSTNESDIDTIQSFLTKNKTCHRPLEIRSADPCESKKTKSTTSNKSVSRVESFAVSEAPIIPENFRGNEIANLLKRSTGSLSVALRSRTRISVLSQISNSQQKNKENFPSNNPRGRAGRRRLWETHANVSDNSDNVDEPAIEDDKDDDDEETIGFNYNDEYDDEDSSSVFIETENDEMNTKPLRIVLEKELKSTLTKRSKSSDFKHSDNESRRSRSASIKLHNTVDLPKRHGGFLKEKNPHSSMTKMQQEDLLKGSILTNSNAPPNIHDQENTSKSEAPVTNPSNLLKMKEKAKLTYKGRPIGSPPPIPAPLPQQNKCHQESKIKMQILQTPTAHHQSSLSKEGAECSAGEMTEAEPDYGTIKGSPIQSRKEIMKVMPFRGKQSLIIREDGKNGHRSHWKGSIRSEIHTVELITTTTAMRGDKPAVDYGSYIHRRLYYPDRGSRLDQKSEHSGNYCGPWYDLWGEDPSVSVG